MYDEIVHLHSILQFRLQVRFFTELRILCNSLVSGVISLFWATILVVLFSYITAVFVTDIIQSHRHAIWNNRGERPARPSAAASYWAILGRPSAVSLSLSASRCRPHADRLVFFLAAPAFWKIPKKIG